MHKFDFYEQDLERGMMTLIEELSHAKDVLGII
jgi:hypothetical protein